jgi:hypothetical protein
VWVGGPAFSGGADDWTAGEVLDLERLLGEHRVPGPGSDEG